MNLTVVEFLFLVYFALMNVGYAIGLTTTVRELARSMRRHQTLRFDALLWQGQTAAAARVLPLTSASARPDSKMRGPGACEETETACDPTEPSAPIANSS